MNYQYNYFLKDYYAILIWRVNITDLLYKSTYNCSCPYCHQEEQSLNCSTQTQEKPQIPELWEGAQALCCLTGLSAYACQFSDHQLHQTLPRAGSEFLLLINPEGQCRFWTDSLKVARWKTVGTQYPDSYNN